MLREYKLVEYREDLDAFWNFPGKDKMCLAPKHLFEEMFRVRQLDVSEGELALMCAPLEKSSALRRKLEEMAKVTFVSDVMENQDLFRKILEQR